MKTKAIDDIIEQQKRIYGKIDRERNELREKVKQRKRDAKDKELVYKVSYLISNQGKKEVIQGFTGREEFTDSGLVLRITRYPAENIMSENILVNYNGELCFCSNGNPPEINIYIPGEWEEKLEQLYNQDIKSEREKIEKRHEEAELKKYKINMSKTEACWEEEKVELKKKFGL